MSAPFGQAALFVETGEQEGVGVRMDDDRRVAARLGQVSGRPERLDGVAEVVEQLAPAGPAGASDGLAQLGPAARGGQARSIEMLGSESLDLQSGDALGVEAIELLGQQPHRLQPLDRRASARPDRRSDSLRTRRIGPSRCGPRTRT